MTEQEIQQVVDGVARREGGISDHPADHGGYTRYGVTLPLLSDYLGRPATGDDMALVTPPYARGVWLWLLKKHRVDEFADRRVGEFVFDWIVNAGPGVAVRRLQRFVGCAPDGSIGPLTVAATNAGNPALLMRLLIRSRMDHYIGLVVADASQLAFLRGWWNRVAEFL